MNPSAVDDADPEPVEETISEPSSPLFAEEQESPYSRRYSLASHTPTNVACETSYQYPHMYIHTELARLVILKIILSSMFN